MSQIELPVVDRPGPPGRDSADRFHEECGVVGIWNHPEAARLAYLGLYALQHRGQEAAGIVATTPDRGGLVGVNGPGHVADVFDVEKLDALAGCAAIGHTRYSTAGDSSPKNIQPIQIECKFGHIAVCHNGNLVNAHILRHMLVQRGSIFRTTSDTEVLVHLFAKSGQTEELEAVAEAVRQAEGAFSLLFLTEDALYAVRDPRGFRPLLLGKAGDGYVVCSETCALDLLDGEYIRDIEAGELIRIDGDGVHSLKVFDEAPVSQCIFEHVYFARPDSRVFGRDVYKTRIKLGESLAKHTGVDADVVVPVPDSGLIAAIGYAQATGIPLEMGLIRNHYVGRTFIEPRQSIRNFGVRVKLNPVHAVLRGRRVILIDDSIVRGTTSRKLVQMARNAGATEVHFRVSSPPTTGPCHYGIDTPLRSELIAAQQSVEEIRQYLNADSLAYLPLESLQDSVEEERDRYCTACFSGNYPLAVPEPDHARSLFGKERH